MKRELTLGFAALLAVAAGASAFAEGFHSPPEVPYAGEPSRPAPEKRDPAAKVNDLAKLIAEKGARGPLDIRSYNLSDCDWTLQMSGKTVEGTCRKGAPPFFTYTILGSRDIKGVFALIGVECSSGSNPTFFGRCYQMVYTPNVKENAATVADLRASDAMVSDAELSAAFAKARAIAARAKEQAARQDSYKVERKSIEKLKNKLFGPPDYGADGGL